MSTWDEEGLCEDMPQVESVSNDEGGDIEYFDDLLSEAGMYAFRCLLEVVASNLYGVTGVSQALECGLAYDCPLTSFGAFECKNQTLMVQGTWACKNSKLLQWLDEVKLLMKDFDAIQIQHISRQHNKEADNMANTQFEVMVGAIKFKEPLFQGQETMEDILYFLETGECPKHLERVQRHRLVRKALSYQLIGKHLYHKGKDLVLRRVPLVKEIEKILMSCHDGVCGGHFAQEITSRKILQAGFVWPSLHRDVQHWCKACKACQQAGDRKLSYGPRFPIFAYGPFEKWGIDAIGPLPRTSMGKQYIITATDYMTRWAEAASVARITAADVSKFVLDYVCSRFGTPLEILSYRGPGFRADLLDALLENLSIKHVHSTPYYPQCNGLVEKKNGVLCKIIT
ncbi:hypothetical protein L7F22_062453 [Adiantum nelumboides]|nr:hypothetical protein [Adiantum nelumboides]